jgi:hypothetical protein
MHDGEPAAVKSLVFCVLPPRSLFVIVVSVLPFTGFDYPFGVLKLFFKRDRQHNDQMKKGQEDENGRQNDKQKTKT